MAQLNRIGRHATTFQVKDNMLSVVYQNTEVVRADLTKKNVWIKTNGWYTPTTKTRINQTFNQFGIPLRVFQKAGTWFIERTWLDDCPDKVSALREDICYGY